MEAQDLDWFYVSEVTRGKVKLSSEETRHLKVKRHYENEKIAIFDGKGKVGVGKFTGKETVEVDFIEEFSNDASLVVATAVPKGERMDFLLQKLTELNVAKIIPIKSKHSVVLPKETKQDRWKRIILEACKQSKRAFFPEVRTLTDFNSILNEKADVKIILDKEGETLIPSHKKTLVLVGPEGGFDKSEIEAAEKAGFVKASVGKNVLRIETAAIAAAAIIGSKV